MLAKSLISSVFLVAVLTEISCTLPSTIQTCPRNRPNVDQCIIKETHKLKPLLAAGDLGDGFKTIPLEPLALDNISFKRGPEFAASFRNIIVNGPSGFVVEKLKADVPNLNFNFTVLLPRMNFTGKYALKMRLLLLNIEGRGRVNGTLVNSRGIVRLIGKQVPRNGVNYVKFEQLIMKIKVGKAYLNLDNLFNGDPVLGNIGNQFINENSELFVEEMIPGFEKNLSKTFLDIINVILQDVTFDEMFPLV